MFTRKVGSVKFPSTASTTEGEEMATDLRGTEVVLSESRAKVVQAVRKLVNVI
jgi:hypothetical protein